MPIRREPERPRPEPERAKKARMEFRVHVEDKDLWRQAAANAPGGKRTLSDWITVTCNERARLILSQLAKPRRRPANGLHRR